MVLDLCVPRMSWQKPVRQEYVFGWAEVGEDSFRSIRPIYFEFETAIS